MCHRLCVLIADTWSAETKDEVEGSQMHRKSPAQSSALSLSSKEDDTFQMASLPSSVQEHTVQPHSTSDQQSGEADHILTGAHRPWSNGRHTRHRHQHLRAPAGPLDPGLLHCHVACHVAAGGRQRGHQLLGPGLDDPPRPRALGLLHLERRHVRPHGAVQRVPQEEEEEEDEAENGAADGRILREGVISGR